jgi:nucleotide-binding universal stress UspA family protein
VTNVLQTQTTVGNTVHDYSPFRHLLVPLDGGPDAERVLPYVKHIATHSAADITLLQAITRTSAATEPFFVPGLGYDPLALSRAIDQESSAASRYLDSVIFELQPSVGTVRAFTPTGQPSEAILAHTRGDADIIVMATRGRAYPERALLGSVADEVVRNAQIPVLVVPRTSTHEWPDAGPRRVLVALDDSAIGLGVMEAATRFARQFNADLLLLHVVNPVGAVARGHAPRVSRHVLAGELNNAHEWLASIEAAVPLPKHRISARAVVGASAASTIATVADEEAVDVVAIGTHGRSGLARLVLGSVATGVLQRSKVPVLIVRPTQPQL